MKNMVKKIGAWLLIVCLLAAQMSPVYAQENGTEPTLYVTQEEAEAGAAVDICIVMDNNPGIVSMQLDVEYDSSALTLTNVTDGGLIGSAMHSDSLKLCPYRLTWANDLATTNYTENGTIVTLTFVVAEDAAPGEYPVAVKYTRDNFEIYDCNANEVNFETVAGSVTIPAKQCAHTDKTEVPAKSADCVNSGHNLYYTCDACGVVFKADGATETTAEAEMIPAMGHDYADAACTAPKTCRRCDVTEGEALGHSFTNYVSDNNATCTDDGTKTAKCDRCDVTETVADAGSALGHDLTDASCVAAAVCQREGCGHVEQEALGHSFTNYVSDNNATCTADGTKTAKCDRCEVTNTVPDTDSALGHDYMDATCVTPKTCKICGVTEGDVLDHSYSADWSKGADGHWHICTACGAQTDTEAHDYGENGDQCVVCQYERSHVHRGVLVPAVEADCVTEGNTAYYTCSGCENWFEDEACTVVISDQSAVVVVALGHSFTDYVSDGNATCTADGTKTAKCDRCDETDTIADPGSALGHTAADVWSKGDDGHWHECTVCGEKIDAAAHEFGDDNKCAVCDYESVHVHTLTLVPAVAATCTETGSEAYYTCSGCAEWFADKAAEVVIAEKSDLIIAALGHDLSAATCTEATRCQRAGCDYTEGTVLDHTDADADEKCDACGAAMETEQPVTPPDDSKDDIPKTGDDSSMMLWMTMLMLSLVAAVACVIIGKKRMA